MRRRAGPGSAVALLCDGLLCDGYIYKHLWEDLTEHLGLAHFHYRGHGRSAAPARSDAIRVEDHARDLDAVRAHLGDPPVVLIGHSFGTQVALEAYRLRPDKILGLVLLCGSFGRVTHTFKGSEVLAEVLPNLIDFAERHPRLARGLWSRVPVHWGLRLARLSGDVNLGAVRPEDMEPYFRHAAHVDFELFVKMLAEAGEHSAQDLLPEVRVPTLVVAGERDSFTPAEISRGMAQALPHSRYVEVEGGTHILPLEKPALVREEIIAFLGEVLVR